MILLRIRVQKKDLIVENINSTSTETHIRCHLSRRDQVCPRCGAITNLPNATIVIDKLLVMKPVKK